jgi:hypothetical protein
MMAITTSNSIKVKPNGQYLDKQSHGTFLTLAGIGCSGHDEHGLNSQSLLPQAAMADVLQSPA